ncbi:MAG TPA: [protein-PII] uridylyltransferase [Aestuariivirgaceae bacterium]|nr:[protein-PII] uridylyltransferase [Aestuariivirgaceae bacterium]
MTPAGFAPAMETEEAAVRAAVAELARVMPKGTRLRTELVGILRPFLESGRKLAERRLMADGKGLACAASLSELHDRLLRIVYDFALAHLFTVQNPSTSERIAVLGVGGYGRGTLAPGSDVDLLFLLPYKQTAWGESLVEFILYVLWDLKLKVGNATRSIDECIRLAKLDDTVATAVLEQRFVCGDRALSDELALRFRKEVVAGSAREFIAAKLAERDARHRKSGESRYLVEPDVKDGKGGLRDLHTLFWIARYLYNSASPADLATEGIFTRGEVAKFVRCEDFLWAVRCHMHFMTGRNADRLNFEIQPELAARLRYTVHGGLMQVERFMKHYFLVAKDVGDLTRIFCAVLEAQQMKKAPGMIDFWRGLTRRSKTGAVIDSHFRIDAGRMNVTDETAFAATPANVLKLFAYADEYQTGIHPDALKHIRRSLPAMAADLRDDPESNRLFLRLLTDSRDPETVLRRLNEAGVLGRIVPDFGRIVAMMQFSMYHHYTVDEHLIRAVGALSDLEKGRLRDEHPVSSEIIRTLAGRRILYVATLLHDIAKGRDEHHSVAGERIALSLCPRLGLTPAETETVAWLIRHHLLMSETAQMRDLNDFKTILDFAHVVQSPERLKLLLILTVVDIRAVGPGVWNGWKGQLLRNLYWEAEPIVSGGHTSVSRKERVADAQLAFAGHFSAWDAGRLAAYLARHYDAYWITVDEHHQVAHARLIADAEDRSTPVATAVETDAFTAITELTVYAPDHPRLLALLTGACAAAGANIVGAQIFTTTDGMALDTILIQRQFAEAADEKRRGERIAEIVRKALGGELRLKDMISRIAAPKGRIKAFKVAPQVIIDNDSSNRYTVIEVAGLDRTGLLYDLTEALFRLNLNIVSARITTFGERAVDVFYVNDLTGAKITAESRHKSIVAQLTKVLQSSARAPAEAGVGA